MLSPLCSLRVCCLYPVASLLGPLGVLVSHALLASPSLTAPSSRTRGTLAHLSPDHPLDAPYDFTRRRRFPRPPDHVCRAHPMTPLHFKQLRLSQNATPFLVVPVKLGAPRRSSPFGLLENVCCDDLR